MVSMRDSDTESLVRGHERERFRAFERVALRRLRQLEIAGRLKNLAVPLGHRLEAHRGERAGQYSIRIDDSYRIAFAWTEGGPAEVEIVDDHRG
jgi:proteic killer suppression protein